MKKGFVFLLVLLHLCQVLGVAAQDIQPKIDVNYKPALDTDEGGFWYKVDKLEKEVKRSPYRVTDPNVTKYVEDLVCKIAGEYCPNIRVYVISNPHFNASMYPNGMMQVWTGLLLRVENEAQLATVLGHEIGHYLLTHQIEQWRKIKSGVATAMFLDIGFAVLTGVGGIGTLINAGMVHAFSRDNEREADLLGLELITKAGYQPAEAGKLWQLMVNERKADQSKESTSLFWNTHPPSQERAQTLHNKAIEYQQKFQQAERIEQKALVEVVSSNYAAFMGDHLALQEYEQAELLLNKHAKMGYMPGNVQFFFGELYRMRNADGDKKRAEQAYLQATTYQEYPPEAHKQLGYHFLKSTQKDKAKEHFELYLEREPQATDHAMINYYLNTLR